MREAPECCQHGWRDQQCGPSSHLAGGARPKIASDSENGKPAGALVYHARVTQACGWSAALGRNVTLLEQRGTPAPQPHERPGPMGARGSMPWTRP
eukprot:2433810-Alexandrium_andersonii.AAC.1